MEKSKRYQTLLAKRKFYAILHFALLLGPIIGFTIYGFVTATTAPKIIFTLTGITAITVALLSLITDVKHRAGMHRTVVWLLVIGITFMLNTVKPFVWTLAITSVLDELIFVRLYEKYCELCRTNKEIYLNQKEAEENT